MQKQEQLPFLLRKIEKPESLVSIMDDELIWENLR